MNLDELKSQFLVSDSMEQLRIEELVRKALSQCIVRRDGVVEIKPANLSGRERVKLVLAARLLASKLDESIRSEVTVDEIAGYTLLPNSQVAARAKECVADRFAERSGRGSYRAKGLSVEKFLDELADRKTSRTVS